MPKIPEIPDYNDGIGCTVCKIAVGVIKFQIDTFNSTEEAINNSTEEAIKKTIQGLCKLYPIKAAQDAVSM